MKLIEQFWETDRLTLEMTMAQEGEADASVTFDLQGSREVPHGHGDFKIREGVSIRGELPLDKARHLMGRRVRARVIIEDDSDG